MTRNRRGQPRYGRLVLAVASMSVTSVSVLGGMGMLPTAQAEERRTPELTLSTASLEPTAQPTTALTTGPTTGSTPAPAVAVVDESLPADSGEGRRAVFSQSRQRVWIVGPSERVRSTYLVSGSLVDNLQPGSYEVYSRSRWAVGIDDSGVMGYFVRFARGDNAAIGFHAIPTKNGTALQSRAELGTPQSHGCIRQAEPDAVRMWDFAQVGTLVVVTA